MISGDTLHERDTNGHDTDREPFYIYIYIYYILPPCSEWPVLLQLAGWFPIGGGDSLVWLKFTASQ